MPDHNYSVRINRREGIVEITGPDKDWIAEQIEALRAVYDWDPPEDQEMVSDERSETGDTAASAEGAGSLSAGAQDATGKATPRRRRSGFRGTRNPQLVAELTADVQEKLVAYRDERAAGFKEAPDQAAIIAKFLKDEIGWDGINANDLYTVYDVLGWRAPNPRNALQNGRVRKGYFSATGKDGKYALTHTGERFALHDAVGSGD